MKIVFFFYLFTFSLFYILIKIKYRFFSDLLEKCYSQITSNIEELNLSVGKGEMHVCHNQIGAVFKSPSCMTLKFYKNGMIVKKGKLRSYNHPQTKSFIQDILDGYFPSELQRDYPNGVPFKVLLFSKIN